MSTNREHEWRDLAYLFLISTVSIFTLREVFFQIAPWIWEQNIEHPRLMPNMDEWTKVGNGFGGRDGVELYALYILMFLNIGLAFFITFFSRPLLSKITSDSLLISLSAISFILYLFYVGIDFPMTGSMVDKYAPQVGNLSPLLAISLVSVISILTASFIFIVSKLPATYSNVTIFLILLPMCFIAVGPVSDNFVFVFFPAVQLLHNVPIREIYFQYDLFLSGLALSWLKLGLSMGSFQAVGQFSLVLLIFSCFWFAKHLFSRTVLAFFLLIFLVLGRLYAGPAETVSEIQSTPLRLDLWIILYALIYFLGLSHWSVGFTCGLFIILHRNFGLIYTVAYIQTLLIILGVTLVDRSSGTPLRQVILSYSRKTGWSVFWILSFLVFTILYFGTSTPADYYRSIGFGFLKIEKDSIYWFYPIILSVASILLFMLRKSLSARYFSLGVFLIACSIGNSLYFFGRSHEWNLLTISTSLLFVFFLTLDLINRFAVRSTLQDALVNLPILKRYLSLSVVMVGFLLVTWVYLPTIKFKVGRQLETIQGGHIHRANQFPNEIIKAKRILNQIQPLTIEGRTVEFFMKDGSMEYYLHYLSEQASSAFFRPSEAWLFRNSFRNFVYQQLVAGNYVLLSPNYIQILPQLLPTLSSSASDFSFNAMCPRPWRLIDIRMPHFDNKYKLTTMDYEQYVRNHPDLLAAYHATSRELTISQWGKQHYLRFGRSENRATYSLEIYRVCWTPISPKYILFGPITDSNA